MGGWGTVPPTPIFPTFGIVRNQSSEEAHIRAAQPTAVDMTLPGRRYWGAMPHY